MGRRILLQHSYYWQESFFCFVFELNLDKADLTGVDHMRKSIATPTLQYVVTNLQKTSLIGRSEKWCIEYHLTQASSIIWHRCKDRRRDRGKMSNLDLVVDLSRLCWVGINVQNLRLLFQSFWYRFSKKCYHVFIYI